MYGLIEEIEAVAGQGAELAEVLADVGPMPGCLNYIVAMDIEDQDVIWVTEYGRARRHMRPPWSFRRFKKQSQGGGR